MIYPATADITPLIKGLVSGLQPYAVANEVTITFDADAKPLILEYQPFNLVQSLTQLICQMINLMPHGSCIEVRLQACTEKQFVNLEVQNTGINLMQVAQIHNQCMYHFTGTPLLNGTLYSLILPMQIRETKDKNSHENYTAPHNLPKFYHEVRKRLRFYFTQSEKLVAALSHSRPQEALFLQKINAQITARLQDVQFNTSSLCKAMNMSRTQLFRRLKPLIRQAPAQYIKTMRLQKAKELLETTDLTISEVAYKTGFQNNSHFTKVFVQHYDILPSVFRRNGKAATNE